MNTGQPIIDLNDTVELNRFLDADPLLRQNMLENGLIKPIPFMRDHNGEFGTQYVLTREGRRELEQRIIEGAKFHLSQGAHKQ